MAYVAKCNGGNVPGRAQALLSELTRAHHRTVEPGPIDVSVALKTLTDSGSSIWEKQYAMQRLAKTTPDEHRNDIAAALEGILTGRDADFLAEDAGNALAVWWGPQTSATMLPLLDERVWPPAKRDAAIKVMAKTRDKIAPAAIVRWIVKAPDQVVAALKDIGPMAEDVVLPLLHHANADVRMNAARILQEIGTNKCLIDLRHAANDPRDVMAATVARSVLTAVLERTQVAKLPVTAPTHSAASPPR
jgi:hypothetical protein